ncbi:MAG: ABC transporter ATP-binding protein [Lachnospiraceae bacterium]|nr:ABC transporter ATP-binding protein [Lachnospiraceae bacterium]
MGEVVIKADNLSFNYMDSKEGIHNNTFEINKGEVILLTGNSGSGKSTLLKCLNGLIPEIQDGKMSGSISIDSLEYNKLKMFELNKSIGSVFQNPRSQFFTDESTAELVFPMENYGYNKEEMQKKLDELVDAFSLEKIIDRKIFSLSSGERQKLALATSLTLDQKVLLFDEPSANLDYGNAMKLGRIIRELKKKDFTVIVSDHRFYYLNGIIDKVLFMDSGNLLVYESEKEFKDSDYNTRSFELFNINTPFKNEKETYETVASIQDVNYKNILKNINIDFYKGETTVIVGSNGAGKTTLAKLLCKTYKPDKGKVNVKGLPFFIMQDPDYQLFGTSVHNELSIVKKDEQKIDELLEKFGLKEYKHTHPFDLSGGQKQRLQIAMAMLCDKEVIIFDEPTSGLDVTSMLRVSNEICELNDNAAVIVISHDYEFIRNVADRIVYIDEGTIKDDFILNSETVSWLNSIFTKMEEDACK